jgi:hypothetical protein
MDQKEVKRLLTEYKLLLSRYFNLDQMFCMAHMPLIQPHKTASLKLQ